MHHSLGLTEEKQACGGLFLATGVSAGGWGGLGHLSMDAPRLVASKGSRPVGTGLPHTHRYTEP